MSEWLGHWVDESSISVGLMINLRFERRRRRQIVVLHSSTCVHVLVPTLVHKTQRTVCQH